MLGCVVPGCVIPGCLWRGNRELTDDVRTRLGLKSQVTGKVYHSHRNPGLAENHAARSATTECASYCNEFKTKCMHSFELSESDSDVLGLAVIGAKPRVCKGYYGRLRSQLRIVKKAGGAPSARLAPVFTADVRKECTAAALVSTAAAPLCGVCGVLRHTQRSKKASYIKNTSATDAIDERTIQKVNHSI
jgi:hypothetical protein